MRVMEKCVDLYEILERDADGAIMRTGLARQGVWVPVDGDPPEGHVYAARTHDLNGHQPFRFSEVES